MIDLPPLSLLRAELATLLASFTNVEMVAEPTSDGHIAGGNEVILVSEGPLPKLRPPPETKLYGRAELTKLVAGAEPLRDDYAPVDQLETR
jgi:hypothetical protein